GECTPHGGNWALVGEGPRRGSPRRSRRGLVVVQVVGGGHYFALGSGPFGGSGDLGSGDFAGSGFGGSGAFGSVFPFASGVGGKDEIGGPLGSTGAPAFGIGPKLKGASFNGGGPMGDGFFL